MAKQSVARELLGIQKEMGWFLVLRILILNMFTCKTADLDNVAWLVNGLDKIQEIETKAP